MDDPTESGQGEESAAADLPADDAGMDLDAAIKSALSDHGVETETPDEEEAETPASEPETDGQENAAGGEDAAEPAEGEPDPKGAPEHWPQERREAFSRLSQKAQDLVRSMAKDIEGDFTRNRQDQSEKVKLADTVSSAFEPYKSQLEQAGMDVEQGLSFLLERHSSFQRDPMGYAAEVIQTIGDPAQIVGELQRRFNLDSSPAENRGGDDYVDPDMQRLEQHIHGLEAKLSEYERVQATQQTRTQNELRSQADKIVETFRSEMDGEQPKYPFYADLEADIEGILRTHADLRDIPDMRARIEEAYNRAAYAKPEIRQKIVDAEFAKRQAERDKDNEEERKKRARGFKANPSPQARSHPDDLDAILRDQMGLQ